MKSATMGKVQARQQRASEREANALSVGLELQADCLAGIWANFANRERKILEPGDIDEGLNAAAQIGDDTIQKRSQGYVVPEGFTHGSAEQRVRWFRKGLETGELKQCDTFAGREAWRAWCAANKPKRWIANLPNSKTHSTKIAPAGIIQYQSPESQMLAAMSARLATPPSSRPAAESEC